MAKQYSWREKLSYRFDNLMSQGMSAKVRLLLLVTLAYVVVMAIIAALILGGSTADFQMSFWQTTLYVLGGELFSEDVPVLYLFLMVINIVYCMFFTAVLIGFVNQGIERQMDKIASGSGKVLEEGHIIILGLNDVTYTLLAEIIEANRNQPMQQKVVVLDELDWRETTDDIRLRFGRTRTHPQTKIICRTGEIYAFESLRRCSVDTCRAIVVNGDNDFDSVRAIIACSHLLSQVDGEKPYLVSVIRRHESLAESSIVVENTGLDGLLESFSLFDALAQILVHTSRQPGLSDVFTELLNYENDEAYVVSEDPSLSKLYGRSIAEINLMLKTAFAIGVVGTDGSVTISSPMSLYLHAGESLIVIQEDDDPLVVVDEPPEITGYKAIDLAPPETVTVLVLGAYPLLDTVLAEYANYLHVGSAVHVADTAEALCVIGEERRTSLEQAGIAFVEHECNLSNNVQLCEVLEACEPDSVLVLVDHGTDDRDLDDEQTIRLLVHLRDYRRKRGKHFSITSEMHRALNKDLVSATGSDDFIASAHVSALLMAQVSQKREMAAVFRSILSSEGFEVYMKRASWFVPTNEPMDLLTVSQSVAERGEVFIGIRQMKNGRYATADINPSKYVSDMQMLRKYTFSEEDYFVVLAENGDFPDLWT